MSEPIIRWAREHEREIIAQIREFVECESPSGDTVALRRFADMVAGSLAGRARVRMKEHLTAEVTLPGRKKSGQMLALGHLGGGRDRR